MSSALEFVVFDEVPDEPARIVDAGLDAANHAAAPLHEVERLACFAYDAGRVIGGAVGHTWGECCELLQLWVDTRYRKQGIGARLVREFEQRATRRGCRVFYLETFSFQAPSLYRALGYEVRLELRGFAPGVSKMIMVRENI